VDGHRSYSLKELGADLTKSLAGDESGRLGQQ
jgi:hypothetical protein